MESGKVINFDRDGALQVWSICSIEDDIDDNPEAQRVDSKSHP